MDGVKIDRRAMIGGGLGLSVAAALRPVRLLAAPHFARNPFALGVAAGDPMPDGFVLWTRLLPEPDAPDGGMPAADVPVRWEVAEDPAFRTIARSGSAIANAGLAHSVHVEVAGLRPHRPYWYRFIVAGRHASPVGTARTTPAAGVALDRVRIASIGCQNYEAGYFTAYRHLADETEVDAVFHYGDYIYEGAARTGNGARRHPANEAYTLADYRQRYVLYKSDPDLQAAHAAAAFIMSFDDHEIDDNWAGAFDKDGSPVEIFARRKAAALQAWYEHVPVRRAQWPGNGATMYRRFDYGRLVRMHVLDTRSYRSDQLCEAPGLTHDQIFACPKNDALTRTMMGTAQEAWLDRGLANDAGWNLIAQQVMVMPHDARKDGATTPAISPDNWNGYPYARQRLIDTIRRHDLSNVVIASGDAHQTYVGSVPLDPRAPDGPAIASEFLATSVSSGGTGILRHADEQEALTHNPNMRLINNQRGYHIYTATPERWTADLRVLDQVDQPGGAISTLAQFVVEPRKPGPVSA